MHAKNQFPLAKSDIAFRTAPFPTGVQERQGRRQPNLGAQPLRGPSRSSPPPGGRQSVRRGLYSKAAIRHFASSAGVPPSILHAAGLGSKRSAIRRG